MLSAAVVFLDVSQRGASNLSFSVANNQRLVAKRFFDLSKDGFAHTISSVKIHNKGTESSLYLFDGTSQIPRSDYRRFVPYMVIGSTFPVPWPFMLDFHGDFLRLTIAADADTPCTVDDLRTYGFNDRTASLILVSRWKNDEQTISARNTFTLPWNLAIDHILIPLTIAAQPGLNISRIGDPVFTWLAFPNVRRKEFSKTKTYMVVSQWFVFHAGGIGINVWLLFYCDFSVKNNSLQLNIVDLDRYVWPGTGQGQMQQTIDDNKGTILNTIQMVATLLLRFIPSSCDGVYLLPGTASGSKATRDEAVLGDVFDDVTVVLENPTTQVPSIIDELKKLGLI